MDSLFGFDEDDDITPFEGMSFVAEDGNCDNLTTVSSPTNKLMKKLLLQHTAKNSRWALISNSVRASSRSQRQREVLQPTNQKESRDAGGSSPPVVKLSSPQQPSTLTIPDAVELVKQNPTNPNALKTACALFAHQMTSGRQGIVALAESGALAISCAASAPPYLEFLSYVLETDAEASREAICEGFIRPLASSGKLSELLVAVRIRFYVLRLLLGVIEEGTAFLCTESVVSALCQCLTDAAAQYQCRGQEADIDTVAFAASLLASLNCDSMLFPEAAGQRVYSALVSVVSCATSRHEMIGAACVALTQSTLAGETVGRQQCIVAVLSHCTRVRPLVLECLRLLSDIRAEHITHLHVLSSLASCSLQYRTDDTVRDLAISTLHLLCSRLSQRWYVCANDVCLEALVATLQSTQSESTLGICLQAFSSLAPSNMQSLRRMGFIPALFHLLERCHDAVRREVYAILVTVSGIDDACTRSLGVHFHTIVQHTEIPDALWVCYDVLCLQGAVRCEEIQRHAEILRSRVSIAGPVGTVAPALCVLACVTSCDDDFEGVARKCSEQPHVLEAYGAYVATRSKAPTPKSDFSLRAARLGAQRSSRLHSQHRAVCSPWSQERDFFSAVVMYTINSLVATEKTQRQLVAEVAAARWDRLMTIACWSKAVTKNIGTLLKDEQNARLFLDQLQEISFASLEITFDKPSSATQRSACEETARRPTPCKPSRPQKPQQHATRPLPPRPCCHDDPWTDQHPTFTPHTINALRDRGRIRAAMENQRRTYNEERALLLHVIGQKEAELLVAKEVIRSLGNQMTTRGGRGKAM